jgi:hypothetical protein
MHASKLNDRGDRKRTHYDPKHARRNSLGRTFAIVINTMFNGGATPHAFAQHTSAATSTPLHNTLRRRGLRILRWMSRHEQIGVGSDEMPPFSRFSAFSGK